MSEFRQGVLTSKGADLLAKAQTGAKITFTKFEIGNGTWPDSTATETLAASVALKNKKCEFSISKAEFVNDATSRLTMVASNENVSAGFYITELGVYATDGSTEVLYAIYISETDKADWFPAYNSVTPTSITYRDYVSVANAASVTVSNPSAGLITAGDLEEYDEDNRFDADGTIGLLVNFTRQQKWDLDEEKAKTEKARMFENGSVTLTNTLEFPFNDSQKSVALSRSRATTDYIVHAEVASATGNPGEIVVSDRLVNGFKLAYTGSASSVKINYTVTGGYWS